VTGVQTCALPISCTIGFTPGDLVNFEKAMQLTDRLGGHLVSGHVDGVGEVIRFAPVEGEDDSWRLELRAPAKMARYLAPKGSIAVNGVSLTVNQVDGADFSINLIPHTLSHTMLHSLKAGNKVNLEADMLARYAERLLAYTQITHKE
jgi:riboflavin synthase